MRSSDERRCPSNEVVVDTDWEGRSGEGEEERDDPVELGARDAVEQTVGQGVVDLRGRRVEGRA